MPLEDYLDPYGDGDYPGSGQLPTQPQAPEANPWASLYDPIKGLYKKYKHSPPDQSALDEWAKAIYGKSSSLGALESELSKASQSSGFSAYNYGASAGGGAGFDINTLLNNLRQFYPGGTMADLAAAQKEHPEWFAGGTLGGSKGEKFTINGRTYDLVLSAGAGGKGWWGGDVTEGGGGENRDFLSAYLDRLLQADKNKQTNVDAFVNKLRGRVDELGKPAYTAGDEAAIRAKSFDQLERRRQETLKNRREEIYARGFAPTSGLVVGAEDEANRQFEQARTGIESDLLLDSLQETQRRKDKAISLEGLIEQALSGADLQGLEFLGRTADIEDRLYGDRESRAREILQTYLGPLDLMEQRRASSRADFGADGDPSAILNSIMSLLAYGQQNRALNQQSSANNMAGLGQLLQILFPEGF